MSKQFLASYLAGFIDGDGSIYVRAKPNKDYKYGFQIAPYIILFQSAKEEEKFKKICKLINGGYLRYRNDGILEYTINKQEEIKELLITIKPYLILKIKQANLMLKILDKKTKIKTKADFIGLMKLVDSFRELNYSKKRAKHKLTP